MTSYVLLVLFVPFMNVIIHNISKAEFEELLLIYFVITTFLPTFLPGNLLINNFISFQFFYFIGAYLRSSPLNNHSLRFGGVLGLSGFGLMILSCIIFNILVRLSGKGPGGTTYFFQINSIFALAFSLGIFILVINMKPRYNVLINWLASSVFAVYLIHDNYLLRDTIWHKIFQLPKLSHISSAALLFKSIIVTLLIFIVCVLVDKVKRIVLDSWFNPVPFLSGLIKKLTLTPLFRPR